MTWSGPANAHVLALLAAVVASPSLAADEAKLKLGKAIFLGGAEPACAVCHELADAGSNGRVGPNLDELDPDEVRVRTAVVGGIGVMPAFGETLNEEQIAAVSAYVAAVAGGKP